MAKAMSLASQVSDWCKTHADHLVACYFGDVEGVPTVTFVAKSVNDAECIHDEFWNFCMDPIRKTSQTIDYHVLSLSDRLPSFAKSASCMKVYPNGKTTAA
jgi:hypothetical protein